MTWHEPDTNATQLFPSNSKLTTPLVVLGECDSAHGCVSHGALGPLPFLDGGGPCGSTSDLIFLRRFESWIR